MTKFNEENRIMIIKLYSEGVPLKYCAQAVGIDESTLHRWIKRGKKEKSGKYHNFYLDVMGARSLFILHHQTKIANNKDWRASKYLLEVTDPDYYVIQKKLKTESKQEANEIVFDEELFNQLLEEDEERKKEKRRREATKVE